MRPQRPIMDYVSLGRFMRVVRVVCPRLPTPPCQIAPKKPCQRADNLTMNPASLRYQAAHASGDRRSK
jgi:hypothetical protein